MTQIFIKTIRNCFTPPPTPPTTTPLFRQNFPDQASLLQQILMEGRLCLAPIYPHACQFHHCTDVTHEGRVAGAPGSLMTITEPRLYATMKTTFLLI